MQPPSNWQSPYQQPKKNTNWIVIIALIVVVGICMMGVLAALLFPVFAQAKKAALATGCMANARQASLGLLMYSADFDDRLPPAASWMDGAGTYMKTETIFHCTAVRTPEGFGFAYNEALSGKKFAGMKNTAKIPFVFDSTLLGRNAASGMETLPTPGRHYRRGPSNTMAFCDGHTLSLRDVDRAAALGQ